MDSLLHLSEDALGGPGVAVGLIDLDASRSTNKPDCPLSPEDVFGSVDHLLSIDAGTHHSGWPVGFPGPALVRVTSTHGPFSSRFVRSGGLRAHVGHSHASQNIPRLCAATATCSSNLLSDSLVARHPRAAAADAVCHVGSPSAVEP